MTSTQAPPSSVKAEAYTGDFTHRLAQVADTVETFLVDLLGPSLQPGEIDRPPRLMEAMRHAVFGGGKRLRPFLAIETARMLGNRIRIFLSLPLASVDRMSLQTKLREIGETIDKPQSAQ